jgi:sigma-B regulation protein RsbU (phosphoserine phosphatase)
LYMALSRTLIRTYAAEYEARPDLVLGATNRRILMDARADLFVTVFYGILDPASGTLTYGNAGHNPPYLFRGPNPPGAQNGDAVQALHRTGMVLGVVEDETWEQKAVRIGHGDVLVLYSDGITEAQDRQEKFFDEARLLEVVQANLGRSAQDIQRALMAQLDEFVGNAPQFDDITLMVLVRGSL